MDFYPATFVLAQPSWGRGQCSDIKSSNHQITKISKLKLKIGGCQIYLCCFVLLVNKAYYIYFTIEIIRKHNFSILTLKKYNKSRYIYNVMYIQNPLSSQPQLTVADQPGRDSGNLGLHSHFSMFFSTVIQNAMSPYYLHLACFMSSMKDSK